MSTEITIKDLFAILLEKIKTIFLFTIITMLIVIIFYVFKISLDKPEDNKAEDGNAVINSEIEELRNTVNDLEEYMEQSVLYSLNPYKVSKSTILLYIDTGYEIIPSSIHQTPDKTHSVLMLYESLPRVDNEIIDGVKKIIGTDIENKYINEFINISSKNNIIQITVSYPDAEVSERIAEYLYITLNKKINGSVVQYKITDISRSTLISMDQSIIDLKKSTMENHRELTTQLSEKEAQYKNLTNIKSPSFPIKSIIKYGIMGIMLGFALGCIYVLGIYILDGKLHHEKDILCNNYPLLGIISKPPKTWFSQIIKMLRGIDLVPETEQEAYDIIVAKLIGYDNVLLIGTCEEKEMKDVEAEIKKRTNIDILNGGNIFKKSQANEMLCHSDNIVFIEQKNKSFMKNIAYEFETVKKNQKAIVGFIIL